MADKYFLVINAGSSSLKFKLYDFLLKEKASGLVEKISEKGSFLNFSAGKYQEIMEYRIANHSEALQLIINKLEEQKFDLSKIVKIGHRVVHGGELFVKATLIKAKQLAQLKKIQNLAPLHNPHNIFGIEACLKIFPKAENWAVFDTAFHVQLPPYAKLYAIPYTLYEQDHVRRYGFHGLSHAYVAEVVAKKLKRRKFNLISCHLGGGASVSAIKNGVSIDTSMGFGPLEGLMMGSRSGDIDPSVLFYLYRQGWTMPELEKLLNFESGVLGVSGLKDLRDVMILNGYKIKGYEMAVKADVQTKALAKLALQMFIYRLRKYLGAYLAVLGSVDVIAFTGGIGERNADVRRLVTTALPFKFKVMIVPADEELVIAKNLKSSHV